MQDLRYPVGKFQFTGPFTLVQRQELIATLRGIPARYAAALNGLTESQLDSLYRPEGWSIRQVIHHVADSHMNGYTRTKLALTEESPTIKPYEEQHWANLSDTNTTPVGLSVQLLTLLHERWANVFLGMADTDFARTFIHPEKGIHYSLDMQLGLYVWHSEHHLAHIHQAKQQPGYPG